MSYLNPQRIQFPSPDSALDDPNGLLAIGGDLSPERLQAAYYSGIFPWFNANDPLLWWSPDPRAVFTPGSIKISRSLRRHLNKSTWTFSVNCAFNQVIENCAKICPNRQETWITQQMQQAYKVLHQEKKAHSIEVWDQQQLVGGLYGIGVGRVFCGESMFHHKTNASKMAMIILHQHLLNHQFGLIDAQIINPHLSSLGAITLKRSDFINKLKHYRDCDVGNDVWRPAPIAAAW